jgi:glycogen debranching enzyme
LAIGPIALCEVKAYVYAAKNQIAPVAEELGHRDVASRLKLEAEELRREFSAAFGPMS